ncbi:Lrp/AsnC family transcriptional regulator [Halococcus sediminicola]|uniref:Lrp/AsnC family transcriptional regulator n=1 Tax=Halococcus sediminicola TaxID=1264579 RepID=UPI00067952E5|nr:Lrp/AsnC family transcriptional regulator [Halococcus sediminicola]
MSGPALTGSESAASDKHSPQRILEEHLDELDYQIFEALNENGRMSDTELADRVGLSRTAVRRRRENLTESGILEVLAVVVLQEANLAYADVRISLNRGVDSQQRNEFIRTLIEAELLYSVDSIMGDHDLFVRGWHSTLGNLKTYLWKLLESQPAVADFTISPVVHTWKAWDRELDLPQEEQHSE